MGAIVAVNPTRVDENRPVRALLSDQNFLCIWLVGGVTGVIRWFQLPRLWCLFFLK